MLIYRIRLTTSIRSSTGCNIFMSLVSSTLLPSRLDILSHSIRSSVTLSLGSGKPNRDFMVSFRVRCSISCIVNDIFNDYITTRRELSQYQLITACYHVCCRGRVVLSLDIDVNEPISKPELGIIFINFYSRRINLNLLIFIHRERFQTIKQHFIRRDSRRIKLVLNLIKCH